MRKVTNITQATEPVLTLTPLNPRVVTEIATMEKQIAKAMRTISKAKLTYDKLSTLKYLPPELLAAINEHCIVTNTLRHMLNTARDRRAKDIKRGIS